MQLMLTGRMLRANVAKRMGVIDELCDEFGALRWHARRAILKKRKKSEPGTSAALTNRQPARAALARVLRSKTAEKANPEHYPAPFSMIELWADHRDNRRKMLDGEAERVGELMVGPTARNLRRIFLLSERMKGLGKASDFKVRRVHVVGAGVMGGDIAAWCVLQGMEVTLQDRELQYIKRVKGKPGQLAAQARLIADVEGNGVPRADVIIEAIYEDLDAKQALYADIEPRILATNTSALPLESLASKLEDPSRLIGLHFFNPVAKMPLVEVIRGEQSDETVITKGCAFCAAINRFPLPTKSSPGFLVNRVLGHRQGNHRCLCNPVRHADGTD